MMKEKYYIKKYLGLDWGEKRIGLSTGDSRSYLALPFGVVAELEDVLRIVKEEEIDEIVLGLPMKMSGDKENLTSSFKDFLAELEKRLDLPITKIDERLSSVEADKFFGQKKDKAKRDAVAAMVILQSYFDQIR